MRDFRLFIFGVLWLSYALVVAQEIPGSQYCGPYTPSEAVIRDGQSNFTISGLEINTSRDNAIQLSNCSNVTIENCKITGAVLSGIELKSCTNVTIRDCYITNVATAVVAYSSQRVSVTHIEAQNVRGPFPRGQLVQFHQVSGGGNRINYNVSENILGESYPEDAINLYKSQGTAEDPIQIIGNWIRGGGPSKSGGGIMTGDLGGGYVVVRDNILVDPGQYGIAIAGGTNITMENNKVYARAQSFTNVGLYVWSIQAPQCGNHTVRNNQINWSGSGGQPNHMWNGNNCGSINGWNTNVTGANINASILPAQILLSCDGTFEEAEAEAFKNARVDSATALAEQIHVYPNPATDIIIVEQQDTDVPNNNLRLTLMDFTGRTVRVVILNKLKNRIPITGLAEGLYVYRLEIDDRYLPAGKIYITD